MQQLILAVLALVLAVSPALAGDIGITIASEYGGEGIERSFQYPDDPQVSDGLDYVATQAGLNVSARFDSRLAVSVSVRSGAIRSDGWFRDDGTVRTSGDLRSEWTGTSGAVEASGRFYPVRFLFVSAGGQVAWLNEHQVRESVRFDITDMGIFSYPVSMRDESRVAYISPTLGIGADHEVGRFHGRVEGAWYPLVRKHETWSGAIDGAVSPETTIRTSGRGFGIRAAVRARIADGLGLTATWHARRMTDDGLPVAEGDRIAESRTFSGLSFGLSFRP